MKFVSVNELDKFIFDDCIVNKCELVDNKIIFYVEALIVRKDNSQNANYTDSYAADTVISIDNAKIISALKEGYKYYDANDVLISDVADEKLDIDSQKWDDFMSKKFLISAKAENNIYTFEFEMPNTDPSAVTDYYEICFEGDDVTVSWDKYLNRVERY